MNLENLQEIKSELLRSKKALKAADFLFKESLYEDCLSRSYYAILHAAKAVLLSEGIQVDTHDAVKRLFGFNLIKTRKIDKIFAIILREEQDDHLLADYDVTFIPDVDQVESRLNDAYKFVQRMEQFLQDKGISIK